MPVSPDLGYRPIDIDKHDSEARDADCLASCVS